VGDLGLGGLWPLFVVDDDDAVVVAQISSLEGSLRRNTTTTTVSRVEGSDAQGLENSRSLAELPRRCRRQRPHAIVVELLFGDSGGSAHCRCDASVG